MDEVTNVLVRVNLLFIIWYWDVFWLSFINPFLPDLLVSVDSIWKFFEEHGVIVTELVLGKSFQVQPDLLCHPRGERIVSVIDTTTCFKEETDISASKLTSFDQDLSGHHKFEGNLISLEETSVNIPVNLSVHPCDDVRNSFLNKLCFWREINTIIEETKELLERRVIHPVDLSQLDNTEIKNSTSCGNWSEKLSLLVNFDSLFSSLNEFLIDFFRGILNSSKHINNIWIIKKGTLDISESLKKIIFIIGEDLGVHGDFFLKGLDLIFKMLLLLGDKSTEKLLLKTTLCDSEINDGGFSSKFWGEMRVGKS